MKVLERGDSIIYLHDASIVKCLRLRRNIQRDKNLSCGSLRSHSPHSYRRPQFFFRTADVTGALNLQEGTEMVMPGDNATLDIELITPIAMEQGLRFNMREGGRTVGTGVISKVIE